MTTNRISEIRSLAMEVMAKVNLPWCVTQHGTRHVERVVNYLEQLLKIFPLDAETEFVLRAATWLHDIGQSNFAVSEWESRENHHIYSREMVDSLCAAGRLKLNPREQSDVAELVYRHNLETALPEGRLRFIAVLLRTADVMDITGRRALSNDAGVKWYEVRGRLERELPERMIQWNHWAGHLAIDELELKSNADRNKLCFCFRVNNPELASFQIERFEQKISGIRDYLDCSLEVAQTLSLEPDRAPVAA